MGRILDLAEKGNKAQLVGPFAVCLRGFACSMFQRAVRRFIEAGQQMADGNIGTLTAP